MALVRVLPWDLQASCCGSCEAVTFDMVMLFEWSTGTGEILSCRHQIIRTAGVSEQFKPGRLTECVCTATVYMSYGVSIMNDGVWHWGRRTMTHSL